MVGDTGFRACRIAALGCNSRPLVEVTHRGHTCPIDSIPEHRYCETGRSESSSVFESSARGKRYD